VDEFSCGLPNQHLRQLIGQHHVEFVFLGLMHTVQSPKGNYLSFCFIKIYKSIVFVRINLIVFRCEIKIPLRGRQVNHLQEVFKNKLAERLKDPHISSSLLRGAGYRLVYQVRDKEVVVVVIAVGKRDRNLVYKMAKGQL